MKQKIAIFLSVLLLTLLVSPGANIFKSARAFAANTQPSAHQSQTIFIHPAVVSQQVVAASVQSRGSQNSPCFSLPLTTTNLLQNASILNLNQTANCFSLVPAKVAVQPSLSVVPLAATAIVRVLADSHFMIPPDYFPAPMSQDKSVPMVSLAIVILMAAFDEKIVAKKKQITSRIKQSLTLHQLQVMRC